jgi:uncharacterized protein YdcH (DUF465 family)
MEWEMLFAFTGVLMIQVGVLYFLFTHGRRQIKIMEKNNELDELILDVASTNQRILKTLNLLMKMDNNGGESIEERVSRLKKEKPPLIV